ncbi:PTS sugar transporter subunit IIA [Enterococcus casseliflavus]|nr:PTS sugar transporter subunit IIA [Enterococcus casseliflavus]MUN96268.1 PTS sugar transporter subunit IIA [Enterococcus casseliflavus]
MERRNMRVMEEFFDTKLTDVIETNGNQEEYFICIFQKLKEQGYVQDSFLLAITNREKDYPTGLKTQFMGIAIPHTEPQHIKKPFIYLTKLKTPIEFGQMGSCDEYVQVRYIFVLGFDKGDQQLVLLKNLMAMFADESTMNKLSQDITADEMYQLVTQYFKNR